MKLDRIGRFICGVLAIYGLVVVFGNMDDDLAEKQEFLRKEILEKGYDADDFISFLREKKGEEGTDPVNWTLDELRIAVKEFQGKKSEEEKNRVIDNVEEEENGDGSSGVEDVTPEVSEDTVSNAEENEGGEARDKSSSGECCNWICFY